MKPRESDHRSYRLDLKGRLHHPFSVVTTWRSQFSFLEKLLPLGPTSGAFPTLSQVGDNGFGARTRAHPDL